MVDFGTVISTMGSWFIWVGVILVLLVFGFVFIYVRKKAKFTYQCLIVTEIGAGKIGVEKTKCGWFKSNKILNGYIEVSGERRLETVDGRVVRMAGTDNFHEIDFKRGIICQAKSDDPKVLVPIERVEIANKNLITVIASADYRETSGQILAENSKEGLALLDKLLPVAGIVLGCVILLIVMIYFGGTIKDVMSEVKSIHADSLASNERLANLLSTAQATTGAK